MARPKHSKPEIEAALQYAEAHGWEYVRSGSHSWGLMSCKAAPEGTPNCGMWVHSTPRSAGNHGSQIRRKVDKCPH